MISYSRNGQVTVEMHTYRVFHLRFKKIHPLFYLWVTQHIWWDVFVFSVLYLLYSSRVPPFFYCFKMSSLFKIAYSRLVYVAVKIDKLMLIIHFKHWTVFLTTKVCSSVKERGLIFYYLARRFVYWGAEGPGLWSTMPWNKN